MTDHLVKSLETPFSRIRSSLSTETFLTQLADGSRVVAVKDSNHQVQSNVPFRDIHQVPGVSASDSYNAWCETTTVVANTSTHPLDTKEAVQIKAKASISDSTSPLPHILSELLFSGKHEGDIRRVKRPCFWGVGPRTMTGDCSPLWEYVFKPRVDETSVSLGVAENLCLSYLTLNQTNIIGRVPMLASNDGLVNWPAGVDFLKGLYKRVRTEQREPIKPHLHETGLYAGLVTYDSPWYYPIGQHETRTPKGKKFGNSFTDLIGQIHGQGSKKMRKAKMDLLFMTEGAQSKKVDFNGDLEYGALPEGRGRYFAPASPLQLAVLVDLMFTSHYVYLTGDSSEWDPATWPNFNDSIVVDIDALEQNVFKSPDLLLAPVSSYIVRKKISKKDIEAEYEGTKLIWLNQEKGIEGHAEYDDCSCLEDIGAQLAAEVKGNVPGFADTVDYHNFPNGLGFWLGTAYTLASVMASTSLFGQGRKVAIRKITDREIIVVMTDHRASGNQKQGEPIRWLVLRNDRPGSQVYRVVKYRKSTRAMIEGELNVARNMCFYATVCNPLCGQFLFAHGVSLTNSNMLKTAAELTSGMTDSTAQMDRFPAYRHLIEEKTDTQGPTSYLEAQMLSLLIYSQIRAGPGSLFWNKVIPPQTRASIHAHPRSTEKSYKNHLANQMWSLEHGLPSDGHQMHMDKVLAFVPKFINHLVNKTLTREGVASHSKIPLRDLMTLNKGLGYGTRDFKGKPVICALNILQCLMEWETNHSTSIATLQDMLPFIIDAYPEYTQSSYTFPKCQDIGERPIEELDFFFRMLLTAILLLMKGLAAGQSVDLASNPNMKSAAMGEAAAFMDRVMSGFLVHADVSAFCSTMATDLCSRIIIEFASQLFGKDSNICKILNTLLSSIKRRTRTVSREQVLPSSGIWIAKDKFADPAKACHYFSAWSQYPNSFVMQNLRFFRLTLAYDYDHVPKVLPKYVTITKYPESLYGHEGFVGITWEYTGDYVTLVRDFWECFGTPFTFKIEELEIPHSDVNTISREQVEIALTTGTGEGQDMYVESLATAVLILYTLVERMGFDIDSIRAMVTSDDIYFAVAKGVNPTESSYTANLRGDDLTSVFNQLCAEVGIKISTQKTGITVKTVDNDSFKALIFNSQLWAMNMDGVAHGCLLKCVSRSFRELMYCPTGHGSSFGNCLRILQKFAIDHKFLTEEQILLVNKGQYLSAAIHNGAIIYWDFWEESAHPEMAVGCPLIRSAQELRQDPMVLLLEHIGPKAFNYFDFEREPKFNDTVYSGHLTTEQFSHMAQLTASQNSPTQVTVAGMMIAMKQMNKVDSEDLDYSLRLAFNWGNCYRGELSQADIETVDLQVPVNKLPPCFRALYERKLVPDSSSKEMYFYYTGQTPPPNRPDESSVLSWMSLSVNRKNGTLLKRPEPISGSKLAEMAYELCNYSAPEVHVLYGRTVPETSTGLSPCLAAPVHELSYHEELLKGGKLLLYHPYPVVTYSPTGLTIVRTHNGKFVVGRDSVAIGAVTCFDDGTVCDVDLTPFEKEFTSPYFWKFQLGHVSQSIKHMIANKDGLRYNICYYSGNSLLESKYASAQPLSFQRNFMTFWDAVELKEAQRILMLNKLTDDPRLVVYRVGLPKLIPPLVPLVKTKDTATQEKMQKLAVSFLCLPNISVSPAEVQPADILALWVSDATLFETVQLVVDDGGRRMLVCTRQGNWLLAEGKAVKPVSPPKSTIPAVALSFGGASGFRKRIVRISRNAAELETDEPTLPLPEGYPTFSEMTSFTIVAKEVAKETTVSYVKQRPTQEKRKKHNESGKLISPYSASHNYADQGQTSGINTVAGTELHNDHLSSHEISPSDTSSSKIYKELASGSQTPVQEAIPRLPPPGQAVEKENQLNPEFDLTQRLMQSLEDHSRLFALSPNQAEVASNPDWEFTPENNPLMVCYSYKPDLKLAKDLKALGPEKQIALLKHSNAMTWSVARLRFRSEIFEELIGQDPTQEKWLFDGVWYNRKGEPVKSIFEFNEVWNTITRQQVERHDLKGLHSPDYHKGPPGSAAEYQDWVYPKYRGPDVPPYYPNNDKSCLPIALAQLLFFGDIKVTKPELSSDMAGGKDEYADLKVEGDDIIVHRVKDAVDSIQHQIPLLELLPNIGDEKRVVYHTGGFHYVCAYMTRVGPSDNDVWVTSFDNEKLETFRWVDQYGSNTIRLVAFSC